MALPAGNGPVTLVDRDNRVITKEAIEARLLSRSFRRFVDAAWNEIEPTTPMVGGPHIDAICAHLQRMTETHERLRAMSNAEIDALDDPSMFRLLLITIPPGMSKSTLVSVLWPVWTWTRTPSERFLTASYSDDLALRDAVKSRRLMQSSWFRSRWGHVFQMTGDQNVKGRYENNKTGYRIAMSVGGTTTGERGSIIIVDDPHNVKQTTHSEAARREVLSWWDDAMGSRLNDERRDLRVIVQQRVHEEDLAGRVIEQGGWVHLNMPMEYEGNKNPTPLPWEDWREEEGELLAPDREGPQQVATRKMRMGDRAYASQYQQRPVPKGGSIFTDEGWGRYRREELPERFRRVVAFADTAQKKGKANDYTAIALWGETRSRWYLLDLVHKRMTFPELEREVKASWAFWHGPDVPRGWRARRLVIEDASSGSSLLQVLEEETTFPIEPYNPGTDKEQRAHAVSGYQAATRLMLPETARDSLRPIDTAGFIAEHSAFPNTAHDDRVDTTTCAILWFTDPENAPEELDIGDAAFSVGVVRGAWSKR